MSAHTSLYTVWSGGWGVGGKEWKVGGRGSESVVMGYP